MTLLGRPTTDDAEEVTAPSAPELTSSLFATRRLTERLADPLSAEDQTVQSMPDTSPTKWHRAHVTWFFETFVLGPHLPGYEPFDERFGYLFNSYYEAVGERYPRPHRGLVTRPGIERIAAYRRAVDDALGRLLDDGPSPEVAALVELGIHHEQQHQELLLMDIKHVLSSNHHEEPYQARPVAPVADPGPIGWVALEGGEVEIGHPGPGDRVGDFHFDNEGPRHRMLLEPFAVADRLVTCGEWIEFMADGGYAEPRLWLSDGWHSRRGHRWESPAYWYRTDDGWEIQTLTGTRPVDPHEPVCHVSFYEADAFATWAGARLTTEVEWEHAAATIPHTTGALLAPNPASDGGDPLDASLLHPGGAGPSGRGGCIRQLVGDVWEWTGSPYRPYPGFRAPDGAIGEYNGKFMINTMVLRGGCAFTPASHVRSTYRNFFHPHTRWHLSGVRLAKDA